MAARPTSPDPGPMLGQVRRDGQPHRDRFAGRWTDVLSVRILILVLRAMVAAVVAALASAGAASASCGGGQGQAGTVPSGNWSGISWKLQAIDSADGRYGIAVFVAGSRRAGLAGRFYVPGRN